MMFPNLKTFLTMLRLTGILESKRQPSCRNSKRINRQEDMAHMARVNQRLKIEALGICTIKTCLEDKAMAGSWAVTKV
jgi:hypothetical protein